jgi:hypothetical protein
MWVLKFGVSGSNTDAVCTGVKKKRKDGSCAEKAQVDFHRGSRSPTAGSWACLLWGSTASCV